MNKIKIKLMRFVFNIVIFWSLIVCFIYYVYSYEPDIVFLKNLLLPMGGAMYIGTVIAILCSVINESVSFIVIKVFGEKD